MDSEANVLPSKMEVIEQHSIRSKQAISRDLHGAEFRAEAIYAQSSAKFDALSEDQLARLHNVMNLIDEENIDESTYKQKRQEQMQFFKDDELEEVVTQCLLMADTRREITQYQREYLPYKVEEVSKYTRQLSARLNYEAIIQYYTGPIHRTGTNLLINTLNETQYLRELEFKLASGDQSLDYRTLSNYERNLRIYEEVWDQKGFLLEQDNPEIEEYVPRFDHDFIKSTRELISNRGNRIITELQKNRDLVETYRPSFIYIDNRDRNLEGIIRCLDPEKTFIVGNDKLFDQTDYDWRFLQAARSFIEERRQFHATNGTISMDAETRQQHLAAAHNLESDKIVPTIKIEGIKPEKGKRLVITLNNVTTALKQLPPKFIDGIEIVATNLTYNKSKSQNPDYETLGCHIPSYDNEGNLISSRIEVYCPIHTDETADELQVFIVQKEFQDTLTHEIGHKTHYGLTQDEMDAWEDVMNKDKTAVTWYVKHSREEDDARGKREDFCESFMLYIGNPVLLMTLSVDRFNYMDKLVKDYLPPDKLDAYNNSLKLRMAIQLIEWKNNNMSVEDIRKLYLPT